jgi:hypothetical protein
LVERSEQDLREPQTPLYHFDNHKKKSGALIEK